MQLAIRQLRVSYYASQCCSSDWARALIRPYSTSSDEVAIGFAEQRDGNITFTALGTCIQRSDAAAASDVGIPHATRLHFARGTTATASEGREDDKHTQLSVRRILVSEQGLQNAKTNGSQLTVRRMLGSERALQNAKATGSQLTVLEPTNDAQIWLETLRFQQRHNGTQGIRDTFKKMVELGFDIPSTSQIANQIWTRILQAGLQNKALLEEVLDYAAHQQAKTGHSYPEMYQSIISSKLRLDPSNATRWHDKLRVTFPPCLDDYKLLLAQAIENGRMKVFEQIFARYQIHPMYDTIISQLCLARMHETAFRWHFFLLESKDLPPKYASLEPLLSHYSKVMDDKKVEALIRSTLASGGSLETPLNKFARSQSQLPISQEILNRQLGAVYGIGPKALSDSLCARFFATKLFRVETVINGLQMMATECIGPDSLREIVVRDDCDSASVCRHLDLLKKAGILIDSSKYSTLVRQAAIGNSRELLRSLIKSDVHPAVYEDLNVLEELYTMHYDRNENAQARMLLAAMTSEVPHARLETQIVNIRLRCFLRLKKPVAWLLRLMRKDSIPLTPKSSRHLRVLLLQSRRKHSPGLPAVSLRDIHLLSAVMKQTLQSGGEVPIVAWREILRRLGMFGLLRAFRDLALWVVDHYSNHAPIPSREIGLEELSIKSLLKQLFTKQAQTAIVAWGFQQDAKQSIKSSGHAVHRHEQTQWTWGLLLLQELRVRGVHVQKDLVAKACKQRLGQLFRSRPSSRRLNRHARSMNNHRLARGDVRAQYGTYVRRMEDIWGKDLFLRDAKSLEAGGKYCQMHGNEDGKWRIDNL